MHLCNLKTLVFALLVSVVAAGNAAASLIFDFTEVAGNVELVVSGSIDLNATTFAFTSGNSNDLIVPSIGAILVGDPETSTNNYTVPFASWTAFGPGPVSASSFDVDGGDRIALYGNPLLGLPLGYQSGAPLSATGTIFGATFASLGMTTGSWVSTLTNGTATDTVVVNVGITAVPVPEPATLLLLGTGLGAVAARRRLKKRNA